MINGRLFVQNIAIADTQIQFLLCGYKTMSKISTVAGWMSALCLVSIHRGRTGSDRYRPRGGGGCLYFCKIWRRFLALINCLAQSGLVRSRIGCNNLRGEERQDDFLIVEHKFLSDVSIVGWYELH